MAYRIVPVPVTFNFLEGQSPVAGPFKCNRWNTYMYATFRRISIVRSPSATAAELLAYH